MRGGDHSKTYKSETRVVLQVSALSEVRAERLINGRPTIRSLRTLYPRSRGSLHSSHTLEAWQKHPIPEKTTKRESLHFAISQRSTMGIVKKL